MLMSDALEFSRHFTRNELVCRCGCGQVAMDRGFMALLERVREIYGRPMVLTSAYRCIVHDEAIGRARGRAGAAVHTTGRAVDVLVYGGHARRLIEIAGMVGMAGIGVAQRGEIGSRFLHLDNLEADGRHPRPWLWSY